MQLAKTCSIRGFLTVSNKQHWGTSDILLCMPFYVISPDPVPTEQELAAFWPGILSNEIIRQIARNGWRKERKQADPNAFLVPVPPTDFREYLASNLWKKIRSRVLADHATCAACIRVASEVHHRDYRPHVISGDDIRPLVPMCADHYLRVFAAKSWNEAERILADLVAKHEASSVDTGTLHSLSDIRL